MLFDYGRYLLIASSRPGTQPANLQGHLERSDPAAVELELHDQHQHRDELLAGRVGQPRRAARADAGIRARPVGDGRADGCDQLRRTRLGRASQRGSVAADGTRRRLRRRAIRSGRSGRWPDRGCRSTSGSTTRSAATRPICANGHTRSMAGAAEFCLDWLIDDGRGHLVTAPSTSPEHKFVLPDGQHAAITYAASMDLALIWDLFRNLAAGGRGARQDDAFATARAGAGAAAPLSRECARARFRSGRRTCSRPRTSIGISPISSGCFRAGRSRRRRRCSLLRRVDRSSCAATAVLAGAWHGRSTPGRACAMAIVRSGCSRTCSSWCRKGSWSGIRRRGLRESLRRASAVPDRRQLRCRLRHRRDARPEPCRRDRCAARASVGVAARISARPPCPRRLRDRYRLGARGVAARDHQVATRRRLSRANTGARRSEWRDDQSRIRTRTRTPSIASTRSPTPSSQQGATCAERRSRSLPAIEFETAPGGSYELVDVRAEKYPRSVSPAHEPNAHHEVPLWRRVEIAHIKIDLDMPCRRRRLLESDGERQFALRRNQAAAAAHPVRPLTDPYPHRYRRSVAEHDHRSGARRPPDIRPHA